MQWPVTENGTHLKEIVAGSQGTAWFTSNTERGNINYGEHVQYARVDRIDSSGNLSSFPVGGPLVYDVARGGGETSFVWVGHVGRIAADGQVEESRVRTGHSFSLAYGAGGYLWLTKAVERGREAILRISPDGKVKSFPLPHPGSGVSQITRGTDGAMWFTEYFGERIGRITQTGASPSTP
jgi:virginiamycin B lyase